MTASATCLLGLIAWALLLTLVLLTIRTTAMLGGHAVNTFTQDGNELSALGQRATRAHGNALEWLVLPVGILLYALATGQSAVTDGLAMIFLGARIAQSIVHLASTSVPAVLARATFFSVQIVVAILWTLKLLGG